MKEVDPCKQVACKLQQCLKENLYQPYHCGAILEDLRQCCIKHSSARFVVCQGIDTSKPYKHNTVDYRKATK
ncbi:cx9C motif-containing protein 4 isoform X1 [Belonocnema kinseyi]|uniref:cx9C motif-containing protein 4 isoform X1 n=1 Tax=Belonocnema kinseyi TaxID=2817044 RepID=UPI00143DB19D|nr:cx9C motif-containing protein 4 isoform X1 [Belonocnema kinseyi]